MEAADAKVSTIKAKCGSPSDEDMLVQKSRCEGDFDSVDRIILNFRKDAFPIDIFR